MGLVAAHGIFLDQIWNPCLLQLAGRFLTTAPPRKSPCCFLCCAIYSILVWPSLFLPDDERVSSGSWPQTSSSHLLTCHLATALEMSLYVVFSSSSLFEEWSFFFICFLFSAKPELPLPKNACPFPKIICLLLLKRKKETVCREKFRKHSKNEIPPQQIYCC